MNTNEDINSPINGYYGWLLNGLINDGLLQHDCLKHYNEEKYFLYVDDNNVASIIEKDQSTNIQASNGDYNETANAVYSRPVLYDHRIPIKERTSLKRKALWKEVANLMGENENIEFVQKLWKQLRDSYVKVKKKRKRIHTNTVTSLPSLPADECPIQPTTSTTQRVPPSQSSSNSVSSDSWVNISDESASDNSFPFKAPSSKKRKMKESDDISENEIRRVILSNIEESKKTPDAVDGFLLLIGNRLWALPLRERSQFEIKILTDLFDLESSLSLH